VPSLYCPVCRRQLTLSSAGYDCPECRRIYPVKDGITQLLAGAITGDSFDVEAFDFLYKMEQKHFWHLARREILLHFIKKLELSPDSKLLEIGCGNGSVLAFLKQHGLNVEGGDIFLEGLQYCRHRAGEVPLYQIDITALPFQDEYEVIGLFDVLEHIKDDEKALQETAGALKTGGKLIITVPAHRYLWRRSDEIAGHQRRYSRKELVKKLEQNGFEVKKVSFFICSLFPMYLVMKLFSRFTGQKRSNKIDSLVEMKTYPVLNTVFLWLLRLENILIRHIDLPWGASLLAVAEKQTKKV
jgi:SAM-dependent methyltransferase